MGALLAGLVGVLVLGGALMIGYGLVTPQADRPAGETGRLSARARRLRAWVLRQRWRAGVAAAAGVLTYALTGWPVLLVVVPLAVVGLPWLLEAPRQDDIVVLEALDRWVRTLAATIPTGRSITDAIRVSRRQAPALLAPHLERMLRRIDQRWHVRDALRAMADDLASPDADAVLASLMLAAERGGTGATATLHALADSIQDRLKALREIEAERAKPRVVVRQVTLISLVVLGLALLLVRDFFRPYSTPTGQLILAVLLAAYVGALVMLRRLTTPQPRERILVVEP